MRAVLIDLDGTLVDSERLKGLALERSCHERGGDAPSSNYRDIMGGSWETVRGHMCSVGGIDPDPELFDSTFKRIYWELLRTQSLAVTHGAESFIRECRAMGVPVGLVTAAPKWQVDFVLETIGLGRSFDLVITRDDVGKHKPDPECYLTALHALGADAGRTLVVEDTLAGVTAGHDAGCMVAAVLHDWNVRQDLSKARHRCRSFEELLPLLR